MVEFLATLLSFMLFPGRSKLVHDSASKLTTMASFQFLASLSYGIILSSQALCIVIYTASSNSKCTQDDSVNSVNNFC